MLFGLDFTEDYSKETVLVLRRDLRLSNRIETVKGNGNF